MSLRPSTFIRRAVQRARRRRYGYAALRTLRLGLHRAITEHLGRSVAPAAYVSEWLEIYALYRRGLAELRRRFPSLRWDDVRAER